MRCQKYERFSVITVCEWDDCSHVETFFTRLTIMKRHRTYQRNKLLITH